MKAREKNPMVSVIVPTYNSGKTLDICLKSVKEQTYPNIEIIVVDNSSIDNTRKIAEKYGKVFIKGPERSAQRNFGARQSNGEYLIFLDSDIELTPKVIEECVKRVDEGSDAVIFREITVGEGFWAKCRELESRCVIGDDLIEAPRFYKARVFNEVNDYDESLIGWEDWDLAQRVRQQGFKVTRVDPLTMHHEGKVDLIGRIKKKYYYGKTVKAYIKSHKNVIIKQIPLLRSAYLRNWKLLARDPMHAAGFLLMKVLESFATALGLIVEAMLHAKQEPSEAMNVPQHEILQGRMRVCTDKLCLENGVSLLDVGCGESGIIENYAADCGCHRIVALDVCVKSLLKAKSRCAECVEFVLSSARHLPFRADVFDRIAMVEVIEHLPRRHEKSALMDAYRVLKDGGKFVLSTPNKRLLFISLDPAYFLIGHRHYSLDEISQKIEEIGFRDMSVSTYGGVKEAFFIPIFYLLRKLRLCDYNMPSIFMKQVDEEYRSPRGDGYTIFLECNKNVLIDEGNISRIQRV